MIRGLSFLREPEETRIVISGAHIVVYSKDAEADRTFFRDVLGFGSVDAGDGWLIFELPRTEAAVHPASENDTHELYLTCTDLRKEMESLRAKGVHCEDAVEARWGCITRMSLPGGGKIALYEPKHPRP
jgi:catechol 2,3-dioxygenase-like lactoylglutathione lyase family enzyme